jgi:hypothetical protein
MEYWSVGVMEGDAHYKNPSLHHSGFFFGSLSFFRACRIHVELAGKRDDFG